MKLCDLPNCTPYPAIYGRVSSERTMWKVGFSPCSLSICSRATSIVRQLVINSAKNPFVPHSVWDKKYPLGALYIDSLLLLCNRSRALLNTLCCPRMMRRHTLQFVLLAIHVYFKLKTDGGQPFCVLYLPRFMHTRCALATIPCLACPTKLVLLVNFSLPLGTPIH